MTSESVPNSRATDESIGHGTPGERRYGPFAHGRRWRVQVRVGSKRTHKSFPSYDQALAFLNVGTDSLIAASESLLRRASSAQSSRDGWVYAIATDPKKPCRLKVGYTSKLKRRFADYRTASPEAILIAAWEASRGDEAKAHGELAGRIGASEVFVVRDLAAAIAGLDAILGDRLRAFSDRDGVAPAKVAKNFATAKQRSPRPNRNPAITDLVIADMRARQELGRRRYGVDLQANNGRDALVDAYQEALDLALYLRQLIEERAS